MLINIRHALPFFLALAQPCWAAEDMADGKALECKARSDGKAYSWQVRLDGERSQAIVDAKEIAAEFSANHVRILLSSAGPALFIGRSSGRLVISNLAGKTLATGFCSRQEMI